ncbi:O-antigen ligase family protein [Roseateles chitinivorans]|uniref:O-antigen ligase family protein n=1 Tax=Roseateles chitinivorans TaxID=2917965 RepID=UPI003D6665B5
MRVGLLDAKMLAPLELSVLGPHLVLAALIGASCLHAAHPLIALREVALFIGLLLLARTLARCFTDDAQVRDRFLDVVAVGAAAYGVIWTLILLVGAVLQRELFSPWDIIFGFDNGRFLNHVQSISLPLAGVVLLRPGAPRWLKAAAGIALVTGGAILSLYLARASILALLVGAVVTVAVFGRASARYVLTIVGTLGTGAVVMGLLWVFWFQHASEAMTDNILSPHFRGFLVNQALSLFATSPWLGVGPMHFTNTVNLIAGHPHNVYVMVLSEYGLPATLLIFWLAVRFLRRAFSRVRRLVVHQPVLACALLAATVSMLVDSGFSGNWVMPISQMWIAVLVALLMSLGPAAKPTETAQRALPRVIGSALVLSTLVTTTGLALMEVPDDIPHLHTGQPMKKPIGEQFLSFRFWSYGWF